MEQGLSSLLKFASALAAVVLVLWSLRVRHGAVKQPEPVVGGLYGSLTSDGTFRIVKVLVVDASAVHVRMYADRFRQLPVVVSGSALSLGSLDGPGGFGIGHVPIAHEGFRSEPRKLLAVEPVSEEELEGYRIWSGDDDA